MPQDFFPAAVYSDYLKIRPSWKVCIVHLQQIFYFAKDQYDSIFRKFEILHASSSTFACALYRSDVDCSKNCLKRNWSFGLSRIGWVELGNYLCMSVQPLFCVEFCLFIFWARFHIRLFYFFFFSCFYSVAAALAFWAYPDFLLFFIPIYFKNVSSFVCFSVCAG